MLSTVSLLDVEASPTLQPCSHGEFDSDRGTTSSMESAGAVYENAALLAKNGVRFAITTGGAQQAGQLPVEAGMAAAYGLDRTEALKAITIYPAQILGIADRYGSLEKGKAADVVVAEGLILQPRAKVTRVFIRGKRIELKTWQEELYEKYAPRPRPTSSAPR